jgi:hypothetical protein
MRTFILRGSRVLPEVRLRRVSLILLLSVTGLALTIASMAPPGALAEAEPPSPSAEEPVDGGPIPVDIQLHVGDTAILDGGALQVSMVQVVEDSRCPENVMCVSAGRGLVDLRVTVDGVDKGEVTASLVPGPENQRPPDLNAIVERYVFSLTDLQPYPEAGQAQPVDQHLATIHVAANAP